jgi:hypothetical protein
MFKNWSIGYCNHCKVETNFRTKTRRYLKHPFLDTLILIASVGFSIFFTEIKQETFKQCLVCKKWGTFRLLRPKDKTIN